MNLWIINHYGQEPEGVGGTRHYYLSKYLKLHGWNTTVLAASVEHSTGRQRLKGLKFFRSQKVEDVNFVWFKVPKLRGNGIGRLVNMLVFTFLLLIYGFFKWTKRPDVIVGSTVHPFAAWAAMKLANFYKIPFVYEVRDLWPETLISMGAIKKESFFANILFYLEKEMLSKAEKVVTLLPGAVDYFVSKGVLRDKVVYIPNGAEKIKTRNEYQKNNVFNLIYLGSLGYANNLDILLLAISLLEKNRTVPSFICRLVGDGGEKDNLIKLSKELSLRNVKFEGSVKKSDIYKVCNNADAFVIIVRDLPELYKYGISMNKIYEYMSYSRPIIIAAESYNNPVKEAGSGISVEPGSPEKIAEAIENIMKMPLDKRQEMGEKGYKYFKKYYCYDVLAKTLDGVLHDSISKYQKT